MCMMGSNKEKVAEKKAQLLRLTMDYSQRYLNDEYSAVIDKLINKMARKREVPFITGKIEIWAAAVIHALGTINFLFDKSSQPYVAVPDICHFFETKQSTTSQKSKKIRDMFNMSYFDGDFSTESVSQQSPFNHLKMVNGFMVPEAMVEESDVEENKVTLDEWELKVAKILGVPELEREKEYNESDLFDWLEVTDERLMKFYHYLQRNLAFPFVATYEQEVGPLAFEEYDVNCIRLDQEIKADEFYGVLVDCRQGRKKVILPLAEVDVDEENINLALIKLYNAWFWSYR